MEQLYSRKEAAEFLGISVATLDRARLSKEIAYVQYGYGCRVKFTALALQEYTCRCVHRAKPRNLNRGRDTPSIAVRR